MQGEPGNDLEEAKGNLEADGGDLLPEPIAAPEPEEVAVEKAKSPSHIRREAQKARQQVKAEERAKAVHLDWATSHAECRRVRIEKLIRDGQQEGVLVPPASTTCCSKNCHATFTPVVVAAIRCAHNRLAQGDQRVFYNQRIRIGELEGHILVIYKALYGLRSSGVRWYKRFSRVMKAEGFIPCKLEPEIWMRPSDDGTHYEYVAVYVDDLALAMDDPETFLNILIHKYNFKLKGSGEISFHLGCDFF